MVHIMVVARDLAAHRTLAVEEYDDLDKAADRVGALNREVGWKPTVDVEALLVATREDFHRHFPDYDLPG